LLAAGVQHLNGGMSFQLTVDGFADGAKIPSRFTCDGEGLSPALRWTGEPPETKSFALIMDDPDAPGGTFNHWLVWDIPAHIHSFSNREEHASFGKSGRNDFQKRGYGGPCPPKGGGLHRYVFRLFAVDTPRLGLSPGANRSALDRVLHQHALAKTEYMGCYERV
jgi:Raf kinase inhibitor-like YbhB/YbcL family protein